MVFHNFQKIQQSSITHIQGERNCDLVSTILVYNSRLYWCSKVVKLFLLRQSIFIHELIYQSSLVKRGMSVTTHGDQPVNIGLETDRRLCFSPDHA